jgi:LAGLIDADG endonuclease
MGSENLGSAANQQERLSSEEAKHWFLAGVVEGEGSVCVSVVKHPTAPFGFQVRPEFFLYQHRSRRALLDMAKEYFGGGTIRPKPGNPDVLVYSILSRALVSERVIPFLRRCELYSARKADFQKFAAVVRICDAGLHRTREGLAVIVQLAYSMNMDGKQRKRPMSEVLDRILRGHTSGIPWPG